MNDNNGDWETTIDAFMQTTLKRCHCAYSDSFSTWLPINHFRFPVHSIKRRSTSMASQSYPPAKKLKTTSQSGSGRHLKEWESPIFNNGAYAGWIKSSSEGPDYSFCVPCRKHVKVRASGFYDLKSHFSTRGHKDMVAKSKSFRSMEEHFKPAKAPEVSSNATSAEILFCQFVAEHNLAPLVADHFTELVHTMFPDSKVAADFACKRTKTTMIIKESLAPAYTKPVIESCKNGPFTLMIDESNDRNTTKRLVILARLFDGQTSKSRLLDMPALSSGQAAYIFKVLDDFMR